MVGFAGGFSIAFNARLMVTDSPSPTHQNTRPLHHTLHSRNNSCTHGQSHEILTAGPTPNNDFTHDVKGNMTSIPATISSPARELFWDFDNQLTGV
jgi:hypothetical protein